MVNIASNVPYEEDFRPVNVFYSKSKIVKFFYYFTNSNFIK